MEIDLSKFHQLFFDDSLESINRVEQLLLNMDLNRINQEDINNIFRCVHSIKGSSGMFAFSNITQFSNVVENYLEKVRKNDISLTQESIDLLLESLDCLRNMIDNMQNKKEENLDLFHALEKRFTLLINNDLKDEQENTDEQLADNHEINKTYLWEIYFKPHFKMFQNGDDPLRIIRALRELGSIECEVDASSLISAEQFYPDECYLAWKIKLETTKNEKEIRQHAFEWIEDESFITFKSAKENHIKLPTEQVVATDNVRITDKNKESASIRVAIEKVDDLINMVGELIITQSMLSQIMNNFDSTKWPTLKEGLSQLDQNCRQLQEKVMQIRMLPISNIFNRFPRMVHDLSKASGKQVVLKMVGETTELDKTVLEKIMDPLVHLIRNAIDHGIESSEERVKKGKSEIGVLEMRSFHQGSNIIIQVSDDGNGLSQEKILNKAIEKGLVTSNENLETETINDFIFNPGFSTATSVTDISGRGVGLDVVRKNIEGVGGRVSVESIPSKGTTFTISLPLTLAIIEGQLVRIGQSIFIIPLTSMTETIQINKNNVRNLSNLLQVYHLRDKYIPIIRLYELFNIEVEDINLEDHFLVIIELNQQFYGILIDELLQLQQVVIKSMENNYGHIEGISGATILGDGTVALILDASGIIRAASQHFLPKNIHYLANKIVA